MAGQSMQGPLEGRKDKEAHSPLKPLEGAQPLHLELWLLTPRNVRELICIVSSHGDRGNFVTTAIGN